MNYIVIFYGLLSLNIDMKLGLVEIICRLGLSRPVTGRLYIYIYSLRSQQTALNGLCKANEVCII